jgi:F-type H+-transporting ATPase subunit gamma
MANLKEVKNRIGSVTSTQQITKAMKMVAAAKLRRAQDRIIQLRPYAKKLDYILKNVSAVAGEKVELVYTTEREVKNVLFVAITSDKGLCGAFNASVFRNIQHLLSTEYKSFADSGNVHVMSIGKKAQDFYRRRDLKLVDNFAELFANSSFENVREAAEFAMNSYANGTYDKVVLVYNEFKNVATQILKTETFLPIQMNEVNEGEAGNGDYIFEPNIEYIIEELIPRSLTIQFFKAVIESNASEHGARMTAMDKATENAGELLKELKLTYNRTRQAAITKEILEIVGGAEALSAN